MSSSAGSFGPLALVIRTMLVYLGLGVAVDMLGETPGYPEKGDLAITAESFLPPFRLEVDGMPLDIADASLGGATGALKGEKTGDYFGTVAPFLGDISGEGRLDLVVGGFSGRFRIYRNIGTSWAPKFTKEFSWVKAEGEPVRVWNWCCVAPQMQVVDIDGDGIPDLSCGSYCPGAIYWWRGLGNGRFEHRQFLTDESGTPIFAHPETLGSQPSDSYASSIAWAIGRGATFLIYGDWKGELFYRTSMPNNGGGVTPIPSQPVFSRPTEIRINGEKAIPGIHSAPAVVVPDSYAPYPSFQASPSNWHLLVGSDDGTIYLLRNTAKPGAKPEFTTREVIVPAGVKNQWLTDPGELPKRGGRSYVQVVDFNGDGKPDLLVGDVSYTKQFRSDLTPAQKTRARALKADLEALDDKMHYGPDESDRNANEGYKADQVALTHANEVLQELNSYLEKYTYGGWTTDAKPHGFVWVFLHK